MSSVEEGSYAMMNDNDVDWEYGTQGSYDEGSWGQGGQVNSVAGAWDSSAPWNSSCGSSGPEASWTQGQEGSAWGAFYSVVGKSKPKMRSMTATAPPRPPGLGARLFSLTEVSTPCQEPIPRSIQPW